MKKYLLLLVFLVMSLPILAQDETAMPTDEPTALATELVVATVTESAFVTPTEVVATVTPSDFVTPTASPTDVPTATPTPVPSGGNGGTGNTDSNGSSVVVIIISILTLVLGGGTAISMIANFRKDAAGVAATEALGKSVPQDVAMELVRLLKGVVSGAEIAIEALDQIPAASKPGVIAQFTIAELTAELARRGYTE